MDAAWGFAPYEKISESSAQWDHKSAPKLFKKAVAVRGQQADTTTKWVVTEKVHGANFCFLCDGATTICAKRTQVLDPRDDFFGYATVHEKYKQNILQAFELVKSTLVPTLEVYGELFGGGYPHPDFPELVQENLVQTGIYYCPGLEFYAFDIATTVPGTKSRDYMDYDKSIEIFKQCKFFYAEPLLIGSYEEVSNYKVEFQSTIPKRLGMPPLSIPNIAEGVVVKAMRSTMLDTVKGPVRASLKIKDKSFVEEKALPVLDARAVPRAQLIAMTASLINENRKNNAVSKLGRVKTNDQKEKLEKMLVDDVVETLQTKEGAQDQPPAGGKKGTGRRPTLWDQLSNREKQEVTEHVKTLVRDFLANSK